MADARTGDDVEHAVEQADAGAQDRHEHDLLAVDLAPRRRRDRRLDRDLAQRQVARDLVGHQRGEFAEQAAELDRARLLLPQQRQLVLYQRMPDHLHACRHRLPSVRSLHDTARPGRRAAPC